MNFFLQHHFDDTLSIEQSNSVAHMRAAFGPYGSYYSMLDRYLSFTARVDRLPIHTIGQDQFMECIDAVTRLIGRKLFVYTSYSAYIMDDGRPWEILLHPLHVGQDVDMPIIQFTYAGDIVALEQFLRAEGYIVNGVHP